MVLDYNQFHKYLNSIIDDSFLNNGNRILVFDSKGSIGSNILKIRGSILQDILLSEYHNENVLSRINLKVHYYVHYEVYYGTHFSLCAKDINYHLRISIN